jgi:hypothetical protein
MVDTWRPVSRGRPASAAAAAAAVQYVSHRNKSIAQISIDGIPVVDKSMSRYRTVCTGGKDHWPSPDRLPLPPPYRAASTRRVSRVQHEAPPPSSGRCLVSAVHRPRVARRSDKEPLEKNEADDRPHAVRVTNHSASATTTENSLSTKSYGRFIHTAGGMGRSHGSTGRAEATSEIPRKTVELAVTGRGFEFAGEREETKAVFTAADTILTLGKRIAILRRFARLSLHCDDGEINSQRVSSTDVESSADTASSRLFCRIGLSGTSRLTTSPSIASTVTETLLVSGIRGNG